MARPPHQVNRDGSSNSLDEFGVSRWPKQPSPFLALGLLTLGSCVNRQSRQPSPNILASGKGNLCGPDLPLETKVGEIVLLAALGGEEG